jgi:hypothetical protein
VEGVSAITVMIFIINPKSMLDIVAGAFRWPPGLYVSIFLSKRPHNFEKSKAGRYSSLSYGSSIFLPLLMS